MRRFYSTFVGDLLRLFSKQTFFPVPDDLLASSLGQNEGSESQPYNGRIFFIVALKLFGLLTNKFVTFANLTSMEKRSYYSIMFSIGSMSYKFVNYVENVSLRMRAVSTF